MVLGALGMGAINRQCFLFFLIHYNQPSQHLSHRAPGKYMGTQAHVQAWPHSRPNLETELYCQVCASPCFCRVAKKECGLREGSPTEPGLRPTVCPTLRRPSNSTGPQRCLFLCSVDSAHCLSHSRSHKGQGVAKAENVVCSFSVRDWRPDFLPWNES